MKIYFAGSIRGGREDAALYLQIIKLIQTKHTVLTEHIGLKDLSDLGESKHSEEIYKRDIGWINESDFVVAEVTNPSLGVGYEIAYAESKGVPVLALFREGSGRKLSAMIEGNEYVTVLKYNQLKDLRSVLLSEIT